MRGLEVLCKRRAVPLKGAPVAADVERGMSSPDGGIVEQFSEHLSRRAASAVATLSVVGVLVGAFLGGVPGHMSHSLISPGVNYLAVVLGGIAGGFVGRSQGEKKAAGLRLQASFVLYLGGRAAPRAAAPAQAVAPAPVPAPPAPSAPAPVAPPPAAPAMTAPAPPVVPAPVAAAPVVPAHVAAAPVEPALLPPAPEPVAVAVAPISVPLSPPVVAPAPMPVEPEEPIVAEAPEPTPLIPRLVEPAPAMPPLTPPLSQSGS